MDDVKRILPVTHYDDSADGFAFSVPLGDAFTEVGPVGDHTQVANQHRRSIVGRDRDVLDIAERFDIADPTYQVIGASHFEDPSTDFVVARADLVDDSPQRNVQRQQSIWIYLNLVLPDETADRCDFCDSRNSLERVANLPVL